MGAEDDNSSLPLQVETGQAALPQDVISRKSTRCLWTGLGLAVSILLGVLACALFSLASHRSAELSGVVPEAAFHTISALIDSGIRPTRHAVSGHASPTALRAGRVRPARHTVSAHASAVGSRTVVLPESYTKVAKEPYQPYYSDFDLSEDHTTVVKELRKWQPADSDFDFSKDFSDIQKRNRARQGRPQQRSHLVRFGDEYFVSLDAVKRRTRQIRETFSFADALPDKEFRIIYDIIQRHPDRIRKRVAHVTSISVGVSSKFAGNACFWIWHPDGSGEDISIRQCFPELFPHQKARSQYYYNYYPHLQSRGKEPREAEATGRRWSSKRQE